MDQKILLKNLTVTGLFAVTLLAGCGVEKTEQVSGESTQKSFVKNLNDPTSKLTTKMASIQPKVSVSAQACFEDPACIEAAIDQLFIALSNRYFIKYSTVRIGGAAVGNVNGQSGGKTVQYTLVNAGVGFSIANKTGNTVSSLPSEGRAAVALGAAAYGPTAAPWAGAGVIYLDTARKLLAVGGADVTGYSFCYASPGFAPVCASGGW